jgi:SAM-dependent methyltransferase
LSGAQILECGCGAGRFTEVLLAERAYVTSVDLSEAVEANQENFPQSERHRIAQADILALPFEPQQFDLVFCLGVVQHTESPEATIAALYEQVKPGGALVFDHYCFQLRRFTQLAPIVRQVVKRLPPTRTIPLTTRMVDRLLPVHKRLGRLVPVVSRVSPVASYYRTYPELSDDLQREWSLLDTHDSLTDWYKRLRSRGQIETVVRQLGADIDCVARGGNGVEARCLRPG